MDLNDYRKEIDRIDDQLIALFARRMETAEKMAKLGMMGIYFPKQYGGAGGDVLSYAMCVEELAKVCGTTAVIVSAHTSLCAAPIFENGTEEQKMKYLPDLCSGRKIGAFGLTEPGAGTDAQGQQTTADAMDAVARSLPALWRADKLQSKAAKAGFEFAGVSGALDKLDEETGELRQDVETGGDTGLGQNFHAAVTGDLTGDAVADQIRMAAAQLL